MQLSNIQAWPTPEQFVQLTGSMKTFVSSQQVIPTGSNGSPVTIAHGLPSTPVVMGAYLICVNDDTITGMVTGQVVDSRSLWSSSNTAPAFGFVADDTNLMSSSPDVWIGNETNIEFVVNGALSNCSSLSNFQLVIWAISF